MPDTTPSFPGPDPIESDDPTVLRLEVLRLREQLLGDVGRAEVSGDRIRELETHEVALVAEIDMLRAELARTPLSRISRAIRTTGRKST